MYTTWGPILIGAFLGFLLAMFTRAKDTLPIGLVIYTFTRTILNTLRSVEAVIMAIVFVIAVVLVRLRVSWRLVCIPSSVLAKLYSEQVESILPVRWKQFRPQAPIACRRSFMPLFLKLFPPYISYTMYRWDINVRMSTIIGIVGGGGIGFVLDPEHQPAELPRRKRPDAGDSHCRLNDGLYLFRVAREVRINWLFTMKQKEPCLSTRLFCAHVNQLWQGVGDWC